MAKKKPKTEAMQKATPGDFTQSVAELLAFWRDDYDATVDGGNDRYWQLLGRARELMPQSPLPSDGNWRVHEAFIALDAAVNVDLERNNPSDAAIKAMVRLDEVFGKRDREPPRPESITMMQKAEVPPEQICRNWGFVDEFGNADVEKLELETKTPGTLIVEGYEWPALRKWRKLRDEEYARYTDFTLSHSWADKPTREPCQETAEELYLQGVNAGQAARMLVISEGEAQELWTSFAEQGLEQPGAGLTTDKGDPIGDYEPTPLPADEEEEEGNEDDTETVYDGMSISELRELCEAGDLPNDGDRQELIARLVEADGVRA